MTDAALWPALRAALAHTTRAHWSALRQQAPSADPRLVAAESVATAATALLQTPELYEMIAVHQVASALPPSGQLAMLLRASPLAGEKLDRLARNLAALDAACIAWTASAYGQRRNRRQAG
jgi:DNA-binding MurR/RpiR family transcriptional regulator